MGRLRLPRPVPGRDHNPQAQGALSDTLVLAFLGLGLLWGFTRSS